MAPEHFFGKCVSDLLGKATSDSAFGEPVEYTHTRRKIIKRINGIFDELFEQVDPDTEVVVASNLITLGIRLKDLPFAPEKLDKVKLRGKTFFVVDSMEDGQGGSELQLHKDC